MATVEPGASPDFQRFLATLGTLVETHASWVVLTEGEAIKFKKPVDFGFLDFSTREKREACCQAELELNRRLAGSVYRAVLPVYLGPTGYVLGVPEGDGAAFELVDHAVLMRRLAERDRADTLLEEGRLSAELVRRLAERLALFHAAEPGDPALAAYGSASSLAANVRENWSELEGCSTAPEVLWAPVKVAQEEFLEGEAYRIEARCLAGHVKDGHGDLRLEHVYFEDDGIVIVDCIEFSDRFRFADTALDIAFLSMDLRRFGRPDLAEDLLAEVARASGDYAAYSVLDFYESYRATVRGKVAALRALQCDGAAQVEQKDEARKFFSQALQSLAKRKSARLICVGGLIASGKSTLARSLGHALHCPVIDSDSTRKRLLGVDPFTSLESAPFAGTYSDETTRDTYERVQELARIVLQSGRDVIVDASFRTRELRRTFADFARASGVPFSFIECSAPEVVLRERLRHRAAGPSRSDAREPLLSALQAAYEPVEDGDLERFLRCDTSGQADVLAAAVAFVTETQSL
jgi:aminoglycoside phosphotransferase family enzyme/predicted kinase